MQEVCPKCGLPRDLCICETIAREGEKIKVYTEHRRFGKSVTIVQGISSNINIKDLTKQLKAKLACGGTHKDGKIELQGSHVQRVKEILVKMGFPANQIEARE
jgi:translation initiation factor 1